MTMEVGGRQLETVRTLRENDRERLVLVRDGSGQWYILRCFTGSGEVYQMLCTVDCPHTPKIEAVEARNGEVWALEEHIQGDTLAFLLEAGPLPAENVRRIMLQLCDALEALHGLGIVHRDIKPENIILRGDEAVLIDFDVSRLCKPEQSTDTQVMGTTGYAAPEQFGFTQTDRRADIYALGVLLNELLTRQIRQDEFALGPSDGQRRNVVPCVWHQTDDGPEPVTDFAALLENASLPLWRVPPTESAAPALAEGTTHTTGVYTARNEDGRYTRRDLLRRGAFRCRWVLGGIGKSHIPPAAHGRAIPSRLPLRRTAL